MFKHSGLNRVLIIIVWIVIVSWAVIQLPNLNNSAAFNNQIVNQPQVNTLNQSRVRRIQKRWGRGMDSGHVVDLVYNRSGRITDRFQRRINYKLAQLRVHQKTDGISALTDVNTDRDGSNELKSKDGSTEIVRALVVHQNYAKDLSRLLKQAKVKGCRTSVTGPRIVKMAEDYRIFNLTKMIALISLIASGLIIGLIFKSLIAPLVSIITLAVSGIVTMGLVCWLTTKNQLTLSEFTPLMIFVITVIIGKLMNNLIYRTVAQKLPIYRNASNAAVAAIKKIKAPVLISGTTLTLAFGIAAITNNAVIKPIAVFGITIAVVTLAAFTINFALISWLGNTFLWPNRYHSVSGHHWLWNRLARFSLWQPIAGLIAIAYLVVPFAYSYRPNVNFAQINDLSVKNQAQAGFDQMKAHFAEGKAEPVTIDLKNSAHFDHERELKPLDDLTNKLQSTRGVNAVYSLTQPNGIPNRKYYLRHQLLAVDDNLNQAQNQLAKVTRQVRTGQKRANPNRLNAVSHQLAHVQDTQDQLKNQPSIRSNRSHGKVSHQLVKYQSAVNGFEQNLSQAVATANTGTNAADNNLKQLRQQFKQLHHQLKLASEQAESAGQELNEIYEYLSELQASEAAKTYFITSNQIADTDFQQDLVNFTNANRNVTRLRVIFNQAPELQNNAKQIKRLKSVVRDQLRGTPLSNSQIMMTGEPVRDAVIQHRFNTGSIKAVLMIAAVIMLSLALVSRKVLQPFYWLLSLLISTLAGLQITDLISRFTVNQGQFNWQTVASGTGIVISVAVWELIQLSLVSRKHQQPRLILTRCGQMVSSLVWILLFAVVGLIWGFNYPIVRIGLIATISIVIFNLVLPLLASATGKLAQKLQRSRI